MKKIATLCLPALLLALFLAGCESRPTESVVSRVYTYAASSEPVMKPTLVLEDDRFTLTLSPLDSYMPRGSYEIKNHTLLLKNRRRRAGIPLCHPGGDPGFRCHRILRPPLFRRYPRRRGVSIVRLPGPVQFVAPWPKSPEERQSGCA